MTLNRSDYRAIVTRNNLRRRDREGNPVFREDELPDYDQLPNRRWAFPQQAVLGDGKYRISINSSWEIRVWGETGVLLKNDSNFRTSGSIELAAGHQVEIQWASPLQKRGVLILREPSGVVWQARFGRIKGAYEEDE